MKGKVKDYIYLNLGILLVSGGLYFFLMPNNLAVGGANGLAIVINQFLPSLPVGIIMIAINLILFVIAFILIGKAFGIKTIYSSFSVSIVIFLLENLVPINEPLIGDLALELVIGIIASGTGMGLVFNQNASTGGTDISAKILHKFFNTDLGKGVFISDIFITALAGFAFGAKLAIYAALGVLINAFVIDYIIEGVNLKKEVTIISERYDEIKDFIIKELERGFTTFYGEGGYSGQKRKIIIVIINKREFVRLRDFINNMDAEVFLTVKNTHEVYGLGFNKLNK
ncbi:MAG: YitT family protein [Candidatus Izemoplasmatales bacterium]|nr:YitT family protein [Candidatus Izemoplasmatales bacterium]